MGASISYEIFARDNYTKIQLEWGGGMERVIIVDDELLFQEYLAKYIGKFPNVEIAAKFENGIQAQRYLENNKNITIAFVDILMPVMDGLELAQWISNNLPATRVVLISAHQDFKYAQKAIRANVYHYLSKPLKFEELELVFSDIEEERKKQEKAKLFIRDLSLKRKDLELYHSVLDAEKIMYQVEWNIGIERASSDDISDEMLIAGVRNVIRYCAPSVSAVVTTKDKQLQAVLLGTDTEHFPTENQFVAKAAELLNARFFVSVTFRGRSDQRAAEIQKESNCDAELDEVAQRAISYIKDNLSKDLSREEVADVVYMSPSHFSRFFKKKMGVSFQDYLKQTRIARVIDLIKQDWKIQDAYQAAGFQNKNYFNEVFRKEVGCSPSEYKKRLRQTEGA